MFSTKLGHYVLYCSDKPTLIDVHNMAYYTWGHKGYQSQHHIKRSTINNLHVSHRSAGLIHSECLII